MDAYKEALRKKIESLKGSEAMDGDELGLGDIDAQDEAAEDSSELAPKLSDAQSQMMEGDQAPDPEMLKVLEALSDRGGMGRAPSGLGERAAAGAKEKLMALKGKIKK